MLLIVKKKKIQTKQKRRNRHTYIIFTVLFFRKNKTFVPIKTLFLPQIMQR